MSVQLQCLLGIQGRGFAMLAADQIQTQSVLVIKTDEEKLHAISDKLLMGANGDAGDTSQFSQFVAKNIHLYKMRNGYELDTAAAVHFTRKNLADALRSGPYTVNLLIGGYDKTEGSQLYYMDYLASCVRVPYAAHGFGGLLSLSILDRYHTPSMSRAEAYEMLKLCVREVHRRLIVNLPNFQVKLVSEMGIEELPIITPATFYCYQ